MVYWLVKFCKNKFFKINNAAHKQNHENKKTGNTQDDRKIICKSFKLPDFGLSEKGMDW